MKVSTSKQQSEIHWLSLLWIWMMKFSSSDALCWPVFVNLIILVHYLLRWWCFDHIFRKSFSMTIIIYCFFRKTFSVHFIFWKNHFLRRRKTSFVWKNEQVTFSLPKISLFDNQRRKLRLSKKIHSPLQDGIARMDKSSSKRAFITFLVWNLTLHFDCVKYWRIFLKPLHLNYLFLEPQMKNNELMCTCCRHHVT